MGDNLESFGWLEHDGRNFGVQEIQDGPFLLTTSFIKTVDGHRGGHWTARISVNATVSFHSFLVSNGKLVWLLAGITYVTDDRFP